MMLLPLLFSLLGGGPNCQPPVPKITPPPGAETEETRALLALARQIVEPCPEAISTVLCSPRFMPIHDRTAFRELIRDNVKDAQIEIAGQHEPGERLTVDCDVVGADGAPFRGALVYAYQTCAKGWYSDKAPHISGNSGDAKHARLFGYVRTDAKGHFRLETIRPAGYPESDLPAHIHVHVNAGGGRTLVTEFLFDDDPRLTIAARTGAMADGAVMTHVERDADANQRVRTKLVVR